MKILFGINIDFTPWLTYPLHCHCDGKHWHCDSIRFLWWGDIIPSDIYKINVHAWKTSKRYIFLRENVHPIDFEYSDGTESLLFWFGVALHRGFTSGPVLATDQLDSTGEELGEEGVRSGGDTDPSLFLALIGSGRVYCRKREVGRQGGGGVGWGAAKCLSYRIVLLSLFVCLSSHCRNQFALCGTVDKERERLPGGLFWRNSSKHNQDTWRQKQRLPSNMRNKPNTQKAPLDLTLNFLQYDGCF